MPTDRLAVVAGEALIDLVPAADGTLSAHPGGGPFNTARTLGRLERRVAYLGRLSIDRFGMRLAELLAADGVLPDGIVATDEPTTLALAEVDEAGAATYRFYDRGTSAPGLTEADALAALPPSAAYLHVGTLGLVLEPMALALEALVARLAGDALVMVDPNCRPALALDRGRLARVLAGADVPAPPVEVVDTIGAGDAFSGGWLAYWAEHGLGRAELADPGAVLAGTRCACLVAALTCARAGASSPRRAELEPR